MSVPEMSGGDVAREHESKAYRDLRQGLAMIAEGIGAEPPAIARERLDRTPKSISAAPMAPGGREIMHTAVVREALEFYASGPTYRILRGMGRRQPIVDHGERARNALRTLSPARASSPITLDSCVSSADGDGEGEHWDVQLWRTAPDKLWCSRLPTDEEMASAGFEVERFARVPCHGPDEAPPRTDERKWICDSCGRRDEEPHRVCPFCGWSHIVGPYYDQEGNHA